MKKVFIAFLALIISISASAQVRYNSGGSNNKPQTKGFDPQKLVIGGGLNVGLANGVLGLGLKPMVGYTIAPNFIAGVSLGYQYIRVKENNMVYNTSTNRYEVYSATSQMLSPGAWMRYTILNSFFVQAHFEQNIVSQKWTEAARYVGGSGVDKVKANYSIPTLLVGVGYRMPVANRVAMYFGLYYDVLQNNTQKTITTSNGATGEVRSPYYGTFNPIFGLGIGF